MKYLNSDFYLFTILIGGVILSSAILAYRRTRDPFHPAIFISAQLFFLYAYLPTLTVTHFGVVGYLSIEQCGRVQFINLLGVLSLCFGLIWNLKQPRQDIKMLLLNQQLLEARTIKIAKVLGLVGAGVFYYIVFDSGGLARIYGHSYGGGWNASGYMREMYLLTVPAILWYFIATGYRRLQMADFCWLAFFASPLLLHGMLGARRGPTLMIFLTLAMGYFVSRYRRPALLLVIKGAAVLAFFVLLLVGNRGEIYIGSEQNFESDPLKIFRTLESNEFVYGAGTILNSEYFDNYNYGYRFLTVIFIRPIPRALWPSKYEDASKWFGIPNLEKNMGTGADDFKRSVGWRGAVGAAPGIVADSWIEFWWGSFLFLFLIGRLYGESWTRATNRGGVWIVVFIILAALSGYLVIQTFEAMIFRFLFLAIPTWLFWVYIKRSRLRFRQQSGVRGSDSDHEVVPR